MPTSHQRLHTAMQYAMSHRPKIGGFPFLAECLRLAGVKKNEWHLPAAQSMYFMNDNVVVQQGSPLVDGMVDVALFDEAGLILAIRTDQAGKSTFAEFLTASWQAGVISYVADFDARTVSYFGAQDERYVESYPAVEVKGLKF